MENIKSKNLYKFVPEPPPNTEGVVVEGTVFAPKTEAEVVVELPPKIDEDVVDATVAGKMFTKRRK